LIAEKETRERVAREERLKRREERRIKVEKARERYFARVGLA
jgi:hypothetical protein